MKFACAIVSILIFSILSGCVTRKVHARVMKHQTLKVRGAYHPQEVGLTFRKIHPQLKACHEQAGSPVGRLVFQYDIRSEDGVVMGVKLLEDQDVLKQEDFRTCAVKAVESLKYDKMTAGNDSSVIYPVKFPLTQ